jgi:uncharacterized protein HemX
MGIETGTAALIAGALSAGGAGYQANRQQSAAKRAGRQQEEQQQKELDLQEQQQRAAALSDKRAQQARQNQSALASLSNLNRANEGLSTRGIAGSAGGGLLAPKPGSLSTALFNANQG